MEVGTQIKRKRKELELTQDELASRIGCSRSYVARIETGKDNISTDKLEEFANALGVTPSFLMGWVEEPKTPEREEILKGKYAKATWNYLNYVETGKAYKENQTLTKIEEEMRKQCSDELLERMTKVFIKLDELGQRKVIDYAYDVLLDKI